MAFTPDAPRADAPLQRRLTAEQAAARALVEASCLAEATPRILQGICESLGWEHGALWIVDHDQDVLRCSDIWTRPGRSFAEFDRISRALTFARGVGLPGRVWATGEPAWIPDVVADHNFPRAQAAAREGLHAAFGFPVVMRGEVLSVMEFFSLEIRPPDDQLLSMLSGVGNQIGLFYDRRRAQDDLDRFFALSLDLLCVVGFDGYFKRVNPAWQRVLGYTSEELLSRPYLEFIHPDDRDASHQEALKLSTGATMLHFENRFLHRDGTCRWFLWSATPFPELQILYAAAHDITERKAAEQTLSEYARDLQASHHALEEQAARLAQLVKELETSRRRAEEAAETKSAFLANMSHEIRTPLNAILGMTGLALQTRLTADQRDYLETVRSSATALLAIINDILDFSKIEARRLDLERAEFDAREAIGNAAKLLAIRASEKGIELACHIAPAVPPVLLGDESRLRQVLLNVLGNAIKFTDAGEVVLRVTVEHLAPRLVTLHFTVTDSGIGIPAEKQQQIFGAFTQADSSTTRRYGGTGLGLAIATRLVALMNGRMWVESQVGQGSTFHFTADFDVPREAADTTRPAALEGLRVLVVDDNATNRRILDEMLGSWRMSPTTVPDATSALDLLRRTAGGPNAYDVVVSDCQMPDVDGFTFAKRLKGDRRLAAVPIVMLTSISNPGHVDRCRKIGVEAYLSKPVKHSDLLDALVTVFGVPTRKAAALARTTGSAQRALRVLVAEDNLVNRKLVTRLLQKRGHHVTAVENGGDAVAAVRAKTFDVVLMDVQMPEMNGLEATAAIRQDEAGHGGHVPIIALTAHAMQGDRERCLAAGMDGYLAKPIDVDELVSTIERAAAPREPRRKVPRRKGQPRQKAATMPPTRSVPVFDRDTALKHAGGDRRLLIEVLALFRSDYPAGLRKIASAIARRDPEKLRLSAHALKGALATVGSPAGRAAAFQLEQMGSGGTVDGAAAALAALRGIIKSLESEVASAKLATPDKRRLHGKDSRRRR